MGEATPFEAKISFVPVEELVENKRNARTHSQKQVQKIANSIAKFGFTNPILIDSGKTVIGGHGRFAAAKQLKLEQVPTICLEHLTPEELKAYAIVDNKLALESEWDDEMLKLELQDLTDLGFELDDTGFETPEIDLILFENEIKKPKKQDKIDEFPEEAEILEIVKPGDLYKVGPHLVYCGDSTKEESLKTVLQGQKANLIFTDPPYNVKINGHVCENGKHDEFAMASGEMSNVEFTEFLKKSIKNLIDYSVDGSIHYLCMDWRHAENVLAAAGNKYSELKNICVWDKSTGGMGSLYRSQHEFVFVFKNGTESHINNVELGKHGRYRTNVWKYPGVRASNPNSLADLKLHPTVKPVSMVIDAILDCSKPNDIVLDAFAGSGTTLLAAERTKRRACVIELDPHYCDVIIARYMKCFKKADVELVLNTEGAM